MVNHFEIVIFVDAYWEKRDKSWDYDDDVPLKDRREYVDIYHGGWDIRKCPGFPQINGGMGTPDMCALFPNPESIKKMFHERYDSQFPNHKIIVKLTITKDDRNPTMADFF